MLSPNLRTAGIALVTLGVLMAHHEMSYVANIAIRNAVTIHSEAQEVSIRGDGRISIEELRSSIQYPPQHLDPNVQKVTDEMYEQKHWDFRLSDGGDRVECQIHTKPIASHEAPETLSLSAADIGISDKEQYIIHIHGIHHTGTGYLRQTLYDALNNEFLTSEGSMNTSPVVSVQDSLRPYKHLLEEAGEDKVKRDKLLRKYKVAENEGQHLQSIYPSYVYRAKELMAIKVRHPMTRNSAGLASMSVVWVNAWTHVFELLEEGKIDWYAVVTYEALVSHHDQVVKELLEVVRSGMDRHRSGGRNLKRSAYNNGNENAESIEDVGMKDTRQSAYSQRRRLNYRDYNEEPAWASSSIAHLIVKEPSIKYWKTCMSKTSCRHTVNRLTKDIFPHFGYVNVGHRLDPLSSSPRPVTVSREFGRVLFSSEGDALNKFRQSRDDTAGDRNIDYKPPLKLITRMKDIAWQ
eukprot:CAMPEP_0181137604 /NCGR_PEP_ID=MMETSP1071-20121207/33791_1 /TAXON_ID=35127 /ORGANISM="Thalassiosira sp., Strain NH16" /LENGTH=462 /DNA_ID=CAMNT_0023224363 /DNA_START=246 /DNA_END=1634 /DNA_ORIENTATION=-